jgi:hypothetical protein
MKQKRHTSSKKRQTVPLTLWVSPATKAEVQRRAELEGPSMSKVGGKLLEKMLRQDLHAQHSVLLQPIIEAAIHKEMAKYSRRLALLLVRVAFDTGQIRGITTNILSRQPGMKPEVLDTVLDGSSKTAKANITRKTPQLETVLAEVEKWFQEEQKL